MRSLTMAVFALMLSTAAMAGEKKLMHCFAFTVKPDATAADKAELAKATDALPSKIPGLSKVWHGDVMNTLAVFQAADPDTAKAFGGGQKTGTGNFNRLVRQYGICMEMADKATRETYGKHPAHEEWRKVYEKVMVPGTTTMTFMGQ